MQHNHYYCEVLWSACLQWRIQDLQKGGKVERCRREDRGAERCGEGVPPPQKFFWLLSVSLWSSQHELKITACVYVYMLHLNCCVSSILRSTNERQILYEYNPTRVSRDLTAICPSSHTYGPDSRSSINCQAANGGGGMSPRPLDPPLQTGWS